MEPEYFTEANQTLSKPREMTDDECGSLPVFTDGEYCISLWKMTVKERLSALFFGKVWVFILSGNTQPPISLTCEKEIFSKETTDAD